MANNNNNTNNFQSDKKPGVQQPKSSFEYNIWSNSYQQQPPKLNGSCNFFSLNNSKLNVYNSKSPLRPDISNG